MIDKFKLLLDQSERILITSHLSSDGDSVSSALLLYETLKLNFPAKEVTISFEDITPGLEFVNNYQAIKEQKLSEALEEQDADLLIILDANGLGRCSRFAADAETWLAGHSTKIVIIDHHEPDDKGTSDVYINQHSPAVAQDIYEICFEHFGLKKPAHYAQTAALGLYTDTGGFVYDNPRYKETFRILGKLIDDGADLEKIAFSVNRYSRQSLEMVKELIDNMSEERDFIYSYPTDSFVERWLAQGKSKAAFKEGTDFFVNSFLRNVDDKLWGFIIYPNLHSEEKVYKLSLRAATGTKNVAKIALALGGGGHVQSAGAEIKADNVRQAVEAAKTVIAAVK